MYEGFNTQKKYRIGKYVIGGLPGETPLWLIGSMFYMGDKVLIDERGVFDRVKARERLEDAISIASEHGVVFGLDAVFPTVESVEAIMPFIAEYDIPIFLDSPDPLARAKAYTMSRELGVSDRVIANGLFIDSPKEEVEALRDSGIETTVLMAFDPRNPYYSMKPENRLKLLEEKLLSLAREAGVKNIIVDAIVIDPASIAFSAETIYMVKKKYGYPSGCAPANALGPVSKKSVGLEGMYSVHGGVTVYLRVFGADYVMYGPVQRIKYVAKSAALVDSLLGYGLKHRGYRIPREHPLRRYFRNIQKLFASSS